MPLAAGAKLGPYEILGPLGAGGMAEVYRARDMRLGRAVAIKVLPAELAADAGRRARLEQEAHAASALNHPNIVTIHDIGCESGVLFVAMELVEGRTLRDLLQSGPLPTKRALDIAVQVASGLAKAHAAGVIHRDLKPTNLILSKDGFAKILDFGLAKVTRPAVEGISQLATRADDGTKPGSVLGTVGYMSPEQASGAPVDFRSDQFSLGTVLYEMASGKRPFDRATSAETMAAIIREDPEPLDRASPRTPPPLRWIVERCLAKDPDERYASTVDLARDLRSVRDHLSEADSSPGQSIVAARRGLTAMRIGVGSVALLLLVVVFFVLRSRGARVGTGRQSRLSQATFGEGIEAFPAWSRDGKALAYTGEVGGVRKVFVKRLDGGEETQLTKGDADDIQPAWSPDDRTVLVVRAQQPRKKLEPGDVFGQYDGGDVWAIDVATGRETRVIENAFNPAWSPDGSRIAVDASWVGPRRLWTVDAQGRNAQQVTSDVSEAIVHTRPRWSPDGAKLAFQNIERTKFDVRVVDVATKKLTYVTNDLFLDIDPEWSPQGDFIYFSCNRGGGYNLWRAPVSADGSPRGRLEQLTTGAGQDVQPAPSRDGGRLAFTSLKQNADIWKLPLSASGALEGAPQPVIATTREDSRGAWAPDGQSIAFNSDRAGDMNIWVQTLRGGAARQLTRGPGGDYQPNWSPDGARLAFFSSRSGNLDVWTVEVASGTLGQLTTNPSIDFNPCFSPDGRLIAYQSDQGGRLEVWLMNADGSGARQLTHEGVGGHFLRFSADGKAVVFRCPCGPKPRTMQVPIMGGDPQPLPDVAGGSHMSFSPDSSRIMDVVGHKAFWVSPLTGGTPASVFEFDDPDARVDYPVWSPDGRFILFDRFRPQGGDVWLMEDLR
jgi:Tol biopolymer transport system component